MQGPVAVAGSPVTLNNTFLLIAALGGFFAILGVLLGVWRAINRAAIEKKQIADLLAAQPTPKEREQQAVRNASLDQVITKVIGDGTPANPGWDAKFLAIDTRLLRIDASQSPNGLDSQKIGDITKRTELAVERLDGKVEKVDGKVERLDEKLDDHIKISDKTHLALWTAVAVEKAKEKKAE